MCFLNYSSFNSFYYFVYYFILFYYYYFYFIIIIIIIFYFIYFYFLSPLSSLLFLSSFLLHLPSPTHFFSLLTTGHHSHISLFIFLFLLYFLFLSFFPPILLFLPQKNFERATPQFFLSFPLYATPLPFSASALDSLLFLFIPHFLHFFLHKRQRLFLFLFFPFPFFSPFFLPNFPHTTTQLQTDAIPSALHPPFSYYLIICFSKSQQSHYHR